MLTDLAPDERAQLQELAGLLIKESAPLARTRAARALVREGGVSMDEALALVDKRAAARSQNHQGRQVEQIDDPFLELHLRDGTEISIAEFLRDLATYSGRECADPLDPTYNDDDRVAVLCSDGSIFSHAHGGVLYKPGPRVRVEAAFGHLDNDDEGPVETAQATTANPDALAAVPESSGSSERPRLQVLTLDELLHRRPTEWLLKGVIPSRSLAMIYGESSSGKTFCAIDLCLSIARGVPWHDKKTRKGAVLYVAAEAQYSIGVRLRAYIKHHHLENESLPFYVVPRPVDLCDGVDGQDALIRTCLDLAAKGNEPSLIVLDTLNRVMGAADENSAADMGGLIKAVDRLRRKTGATVMLIHHSGKDRNRGARGHSSLRAAVDVEIEVSSTSSGRCAKVTKSRDGTDDARFLFRLHPVRLGLDEDLDDITSCVALPIERPALPMPEDERLQEPRGRWQVALVDAAKAAPGGLTAAALFTAAGADDYAERGRASRALDSLIGHGVLVKESGLVKLRSPSLPPRLS